MNKVSYYIMSLKEVSKVLSLFIFDDLGVMPLSEKIYTMYPNLKGKINKSDIGTDLELKIESLIKDDYESFISLNEDIDKKYSAVTEPIEDEYLKTINKYFEIDKDYDIKAGIGLIPVFPRDIQNSLYYIGLADNQMVIETFIHEVCHFAFFEKCKEIFDNLDDSDYNSPSLLWYLSEIVIDVILNNEVFSKISNIKFRSYEKFYDIKINNQCIIDTINKIFSENTVSEAIYKSYEYLLDNEEIFRKLASDSREVSRRKLIIKKGVTYGSN